MRCACNSRWTNRVSTVSYPNGQATSYSYFDNAGDHRLQQIHHRVLAGATLAKFDYTYDAVGNIKSWSQQRGASPATVLSLGYDVADQLVTASQVPAGTSPTRFAYAYDPSGNRTAEQLDDAVTGAVYNSRNQIISQQPGGALLFRGTVNEPAAIAIAGQSAQVRADNSFAGSVSVVSGTSTVEVVAKDSSGNTRTNTYQVTQTGSSKSLTYDATGNATSDGTRGFDWDAEDRLVTVKQGSTTIASFAYDALGRRVQKVAGGVTHTYIYDGAQAIEERLSGASAGTIRYFHGQV